MNRRKKEGVFGSVDGRGFKSRARLYLTSAIGRGGAQGSPREALSIGGQRH